jgi:16S rRNA (cytidine1402-2'-O)-methyltransferase
LSELAARAAQDADMVRGEITLVVGGAPAVAAGDFTLLSRALPLLLRDLPPARAAAIASRLSGVSRRAAYELALQWARDPGALTKTL